MKKNKKEIAKRQSKAKERAKKKRQVRLVKMAPRVIERPAISQMEAPKGFIAVSSSQALMEYAKPLMEEGTQGLDALNRRMELATSLWNLAVGRQKNERQEDSRWMERAKTSAKKVLNLDGAERDRYIEKMIARQAHLFPEEVQPKPPSMFMYMRKDVSHLIPPFDENRIRFRLNQTIPPDEKDRRLIDRIEELDNQIRKGSDYDTYEKLALAIEDESETGFKKWLIAKGFEDDPENYIRCPEIYLTFVYRYMHDDPVLLKSVSARYIIEFFEDFLLRKVMCEPSEYLYWPPALKLFYRFLEEKGYLTSNECAVIQGCLEAMEPHFLEILQRRYH